MDDAAELHPADCARIAAPTLVLLADHDELVSIEEATETSRLLPKAELAIVPGADHGAFFYAKVRLLQLLMLDFLLRHCGSARQDVPNEGMAETSSQRVTAK